eukprot:CAMPEP_0177648204 /NCGR_PEP_ID=MMETSP0447-20121125/10706_1 /TAXON_ID=0 /ORGANISM="Stygamoeba regulata, Strain BSH-02190019" /LENGTH=617 /DNA_ID=CAMNT_0019150835 /DNA_START=198 /DNA_END=2051 /DNA_ORIENTATION=+
MRPAAKSFPALVAVCLLVAALVAVAVVPTPAEATQFPSLFSAIVDRYPHRSLDAVQREAEAPRAPGSSWAASADEWVSPLPTFNLRSPNTSHVVAQYHQADNVPLLLSSLVNVDVEYTQEKFNSSDPLVQVCVTSQMPVPLNQFEQWKTVCTGTGGDAYYLQVPNGVNMVNHTVNERHTVYTNSSVGFVARPGATYVSVALMRNISYPLDVSVTLRGMLCRPVAAAVPASATPQSFSPFLVDLLPEHMLAAAATCAPSPPLELTLNEEPAPLFNLDNGDNYFRFTVQDPLQANERPGQLQLSLISPKGAPASLELQLYLRYLGLPTSDVYDATLSLSGAAQTKSLTVTTVPFTSWEYDPDYSSEWFLVVHASQKVSDIQLGVDLNNCIGDTYGALVDDSKQGMANNITGTCTGNNTKAGTNLNQLSLGDVLSGTVQPKKIDYYQIRTSNAEGTYVSVSVNGVKVPAPPIYLGMDVPPTKKSFIQTSQGNAINQLVVPSTIDAAIEHTWFVGVDAGSSSSITPYRIWSGDVCAGNCSSTEDKVQGTCEMPCPFCTDSDYIAPTCVCEGNYRGVSCDENQNYKLQYIILICVGGALVIFVAVGVPLYCYFNKKRDYETV